MAVTRGGEADKKCSLGIHLALVNFPPLLPVHDHPSKRTILCPTWLMHEKKSAAPFFYPFFLPSSAVKEKNRWRDTKRPSVMFALAGKQACVCTQHDSPGPRSSPPPRGPLNAPPTLVVSTPLLHIASDRAGISLSQQVCVVLCSVVSSREVFAAER